MHLHILTQTLNEAFTRLILTYCHSLFLSSFHSLVLSLFHSLILSSFHSLFLFSFHSLFISSFHSLRRHRRSTERISKHQQILIRVGGRYQRSGEQKIHTHTLSQLEIDVFTSRFIRGKCQGDDDCECGSGTIQC